MARNHQNHLVLAEEQKQKQIKELMRQYTALMKEAKYREAEMAAVKARELDPDNQRRQRRHLHGAPSTTCNKLRTASNRGRKS